MALRWHRIQKMGYSLSQALVEPTKLPETTEASEAAYNVVEAQAHQFSHDHWSDISKISPMECQ